MKYFLGLLVFVTGFVISSCCDCDEGQTEEKTLVLQMIGVEGSAALLNHNDDPDRFDNVVLFFQRQDSLLATLTTGVYNERPAIQYAGVNLFLQTNCDCASPAPLLSQLENPVQKISLSTDHDFNPEVGTRIDSILDFNSLNRDDHLHRFNIDFGPTIGLKFITPPAKPDTFDIYVDVLDFDGEHFRDTMFDVALSPW